MLKTGRTHQIRVHLSHHNLPILGDPLYNSKSKTSRLMLHAFRLSFTHPLTLEKLSFTTLSDTFEKELKRMDDCVIHFYILKKQGQEALLFIDS